jgi:ribosomal protein S18 acetylase RimI-like enzyme
MQVVDARNREDFDAARRLFREYAARLGVDLGFQRFDDEVAAIETIYAPPAGALLLLKYAGELVGCVGLRRLGNDAEMKRLYVIPTARGRGAGRALVEAICNKARDLGYRRIVLDTLPSMIEAQALYEAMGFTETQSYYQNPIAGTKFLVREL